MVEVTTLQKYVIELAIIIVLIAGIAQFRSPLGARRGNYTAALALALAIVFVLVSNNVHSWWIIVPSFVVGALIGYAVAVRVNMIQIPALVAFQHGAGGVAALLVSFVELTRSSAELTPIGTISGYVGLIVGSATFAGSMIAAGKLANKLKQKPTVFRQHNLILLLIIAVGVALTVAGALTGGVAQQLLLLGLIATSMILGVVFAIRIGGADMPVLISFLNATAGLAAAFVGVVIESTLLIAAGATVASSGSILTWVMCTGMNRSLLNVLIGQRKKKGASAQTPAAKPAAAAPAPAADDPQSRALAALRGAQSVIVVPGYGMAQAHAAFEVVRLANLLEKEGKQVRYAVHPVAGRMPGHMHVLLAEAEVEYEKLFEMQDINDDFASTDVVLVVGACDVVNPAANSSEDTPISGMPILNADQAGAVIVCNLDEKPGYSGVPNPLYDDPKALLLFGDAKGTLEGLIAGLERGDAAPAPAAPAADDPQSRALAALRGAQSVIVVPGYGMAQAHAAFEVVRLANLLEKEGKQVRYAVHPVAGRMPGHMHVLLAEAEVEYEKLFEMQDINDDFASTDVVLVVGACDVVNPAANSSEDTPISGMPILNADQAGAVIVCNLDEKPGYSGVPNPLYDDPKALLLFGDAKGTLEGLIAGLERGDAAPAPAAPAADDPQSRALAALRGAQSVIVVPGYGMAQAHAAFEVVRLANLLEKEGKQVRYAVHPVAGRMPGHMHVLLAEAEVEYEKLFEMQDINDDFASTDVVLVVGACDVVNPAANSSEDTPISGMPILNADQAGAVIVCNLDEKPGYSGVPNPLYDDPKALLLFGDAKGTLEGLIAGLEKQD